MDPLATPADLENLAGLGLPQDRAEFLLARASEVVRDHCGWHIAPTLTEDVTVDGSGAKIQPLPTLYLTAVTSVTELGEAVDLTMVDFSQVGLLDRRDGCFWTHRMRGIVANITHGYASAPLPVNSLVCEIAARAAGPGGRGILRVSTGPFSTTYSQAGQGQAAGFDVLDADALVLARYTIPERA